MEYYLKHLVLLVFFEQILLFLISGEIIKSIGKLSLSNRTLENLGSKVFLRSYSGYLFWGLLKIEICYLTNKHINFIISGYCNNHISVFCICFFQESTWMMWPLPTIALTSKRLINFLYIFT